MMLERQGPPGPLPTGWLERGGRLAGQTTRSAARFMVTRARGTLAPTRRQELLDGFHEKTARQIVAMLGEMKGAAMKLGQLASFYEFAGANDATAVYQDAFAMLQSSAPPMDPRASRRVIEEDLGVPVREVFPKFEDDPVASASIGQVHRATLPSGETVAVKVQYPGIAEAVRADLKSFSAMTKLAVAFAPNLDPKEIVGEVRERVLEELDYRLEARNQQTFRELYDGHPFVVIPDVYTDYCTNRVITQEFIEGERFVTATAWNQDDKDHFGEVLYRFFYGSFNRFGIFSADPHPGNFLLLTDGRVAFLDFGVCRSVNGATHEALLDVTLALIEDDRTAARRALEALGILGPRTPEIDEVWDHLQAMSAPILSDEPTRIEPEMAARLGLSPSTEAFKALRKLGMPALIVTLNRMSLGVASLLARLEATANWQAIGREMWFGEPSRTALGALEEQWLDEFHPEWEPPRTRSRRSAGSPRSLTRPPLTRGRRLSGDQLASSRRSEDMRAGPVEDTSAASRPPLSTACRSKGTCYESTTRRLVRDQERKAKYPAAIDVPET